MMIKNVISQRPHNCINKKLVDGKYSFSLIYIDDFDRYMDDLEEICLEIRDKGYKTKIEYSVSNVNERDINYLIETKNLVDPIEYEKIPIGMDEYYSMRMMGIDASDGYRIVENWIHEKSFISENVYIEIENVQELTHIEKEYPDGRTTEGTKFPLYYKLVTSKELLKMEIDIDDDIRECAERCKYLYGADKMEISEGKYYIRIELKKFKEISNSYYESNCY